MKNVIALGQLIGLLFLFCLLLFLLSVMFLKPDLLMHKQEIQGMNPLPWNGNHFSSVKKI